MTSTRLKAALVVLFALAFAPSAQSQGVKEKVKSAKELAQFYLERELQAPAGVKVKLAKLRAAMAKKGAKYTVGYTSVLDKKISEITGFIPPKPKADFIAYLNKANERAAATERRLQKKRLEKTIPPKVMAGDDFKPTGSFGSGALTGAPGVPEGAVLVPSACSPGANRWSWGPRVPPIQYQGGCGSCWAFASMATVETSNAIVNDSVYNFSEQDVLDCARDESGGDVGGCHGGRYEEVFDYLTRAGITDENATPYTYQEGTCSSKSANRYGAEAWGFVDPGSYSAWEWLPVAENKLKDAICKYGAVSVVVFASYAFQAYTGGVFSEPDASGEVNHAVNLVGWDDDKGAWLLRNSWGMGWGDNGYMWITYGSNSVGAYATWAVAKEGDGGINKDGGVFWTKDVSAKNSSGKTVALSMKYLSWPGTGEWGWVPGDGASEPALSYDLAPGSQGLLTGPLGSPVRARKVVVSARSADGTTTWPERSFDVVPEKSYAAKEVGVFSLELQPGGAYGNAGGSSGGSDSSKGSGGSGGGSSKAQAGTAEFGPSGYTMWKGWPTKSPKNCLVQNDDVFLELSSTSSGYERYLDFYISGRTTGIGTPQLLEISFDAKSSLDGNLEAYIYNWQTKKWNYVGKKMVKFGEQKLTFASPTPKDHVSADGKVNVRFVQRSTIWNTILFSADAVKFKIVTK